MPRHGAAKEAAAAARCTYLLEFLVVFAVDSALVGGAFTTLGFSDESDKRGLEF